MNQPTATLTPDAGDPGLAVDAPPRPTGADHESLAPGFRLDEYEIRSVLNAGPTCIRYLATDHGLRRDVVIWEYLPATLACRIDSAKVLPRPNDCGEAFAQGLQSFVDEARVLALLEHPALPRVHRSIEAHGTAYVVTPAYDGIRLDVARAGMNRPPDEAWLLDLLLPLLGALEALNEAGHHHWGISPENILLLGDGHPMLLGGGEPERLVSTLPAPAFAPIERYAGMSQLQQGPWTGLYGVGALAYYCISGQAPLAATVRTVDDPLEPLFEVVDRLGRRFPELNYGVALVSTIERALRVRPQERPQCVADFREALLGGRGLGALPDTDRPQAADVPPENHFDSAYSDPFSPAPPAPSEAPAEDIPPARDEAWTPTATPWPDLDPGSAAPHWPTHETAPPAETDSQVDFRPSEDGETKSGWRRAGLPVLIVLLIIALGIGGASLWSDYRDATVLQQAMTTPPPPADRPTAIVPPQAPEKLPPPATIAAEPAPQAQPAAPQSPALPPQAGDATAIAQPVDAPLTTQPPADEPTPPQATTPETPKTAIVPPPVEEVRPPPTPAPVKAKPAPPAAKPVRREPSNPRALCAPRTLFALYRCMTLECKRPKYFNHAECKYLRATDEVRPLD